MAPIADLLPTATSRFGGLLGRAAREARRTREEREEPAMTNPEKVMPEPKKRKRHYYGMPADISTYTPEQWNEFSTMLAEAVINDLKNNGAWPDSVDPTPVDGKNGGENMNEVQIPHVTLGDQYFKAIAYAAEAHRDQVRKSTNIAYISHPLGVSALLLEVGGDEDQAIAGLLHDVAEDCGGEDRLLEINQLFGDRVSQIVRGCSESLVASDVEKAPWLERKEAHIEHLKSGDFDTLLVTAADKTHNARAIATDIQSAGNKVWERFNKQATPKLILWYYNSIYEVLENGGVTAALLNPLRTAIGIMESSVESDGFKADD